MIYWVAAIASGALLASIIVSACILSGRISREEERRELEAEKAAFLQRGNSSARAQWL